MSKAFGTKQNMKICTNCKKNEIEAKFYKSNRGSMCAKCFNLYLKFHRESTPNGFAVYTLARIKGRLKRDKNYAHVELRIGRDEFHKFVSDSWDRILEIKNNGDKPSIDRIDSSGHYEIGNIRFIALSLNCLRGGITHAARASKSVLGYTDDNNMKIVFSSKEQASRWGFGSTPIFRAIIDNKKYRDFNWRHL